MKFRKMTSLLLTAAVAVGMAVTILPANIVYADPSATVSGDANCWGDGGQIQLSLSGCSGYASITVVVEFNGTISSASGWGFDSYVINGNQVTATVSATGPNSWGFDGNVGIQVTGTNVTSASLVSITGSGTATVDNGGNNGNGDNSGNNGNGGADTTPAATPGPNRPSVTGDYTPVVGDDWLTTDGDKIVDMNGNEVWLTGCNWFGYNTGTNLFDGVWNCNLKSSLEGIADHGFNLLRVPMSAELLLQWSRGEYPQANYNQAYNSELNSMNSLEIFDYVLDLCAANGMKVMIDIHTVPTDASGHNRPLWYTDSMSDQDFFDALDWVSARYANNDTVIAYDLKNEPHGKASETDHAIWNDSDDMNNWKAAAEKAGNIILDNNPHALIMIEGIQIFPIDPKANDFTSTNDDDYYNSWWGGNLRAVEYYPIDFGSPERNAQIVYSPHDYGPAVYAQPWFEGGFTYQSLMDDYWYDAWLYIDDQGIAPLLIGEWGGFMSGDNLTWMEYMRDLIAEYHLNHTFWCYNANSGDTGGLVKDDFVTWDSEKYALVETVLWKNSEGKFIGLDHAVPLGVNGISLSEYSGDEVTPAPTVAPTTAPSDDANVTTTAASEAETTEATETIIETYVTEITDASGEVVETQVVETVVVVKAEDSSSGPSGAKIAFSIIGAVLGAFVLGIGGRFVYLLGYGLKPKEALKNLFHKV